MVNPVPVDRMTSVPSEDRRYLPAVPASGFVLADDESLPAGLRRVTLEEFDRAVEGLTGDRAQLDVAVHEARKSMKRLRAVLRLVRSEIGRKRYRAENAVLRDAARLLAPIRDGAVMVETVRGLCERFDGKLSPDVLAGLEGALAARHERRRSHALEDLSLFPRVITTLRVARARYAAWPVDDDLLLPPGSSRRPIRHSFDAIALGLERTYLRGRSEMLASIDKPTAEHFHAWRKRVKYLRHQMEVLTPLWPEVVSGYADTLDRLGETLGDEHDIAVLLHLVASVPSLCPDPLDRSLLAALAQHRRAELRVSAMTMGNRVFAERPDQFVERMGAYWAAWTAPHPLGM